VTFVPLTGIDGRPVFFQDVGAALMTATTHNAAPATALYPRNVVGFGPPVAIIVDGAPATVAAALDPGWGTPAAYYRPLPLVDGSTVIVENGIVRAIVERIDPNTSDVWLAAVNPAAPPVILVVDLPPAAVVLALT
jgi:hypothetical protein